MLLSWLSILGEFNLTGDVMIRLNAGLWRCLLHQFFDFLFYLDEKFFTVTNGRFSS